MIERRRIWTGAAALSFAAGMYLAGPYGAERPLQAAADVSPALNKESWKSLVNEDQVSEILKTQIGAIEKSMKSAGTFRRALKKMEIAGRVIAVVGNVETYRLEGDEAKKGAALREAGLALTKAAGDKNFEDASKAFAAIKGYPKEIEPAADAAPAEWTKMLDIDGLMTGVATSDIESKRISGIAKSTEFKKEAKAGESYALLLAILGTVAREYEADDDWKKWCDEMRDGSVAFAGAFAQKDQDVAKSARDTMLKSCAACHEAYRVEE